MREVVKTGSGLRNLEIGGEEALCNQRLAPPILKFRRPDPCLENARGKHDINAESFFLSFIFLSSTPFGDDKKMNDEKRRGLIESLIA